MSHDLSEYLKDPKLLKRFWSKIQVCEHGLECKECCWPWLAGMHPRGYGKFHLEGSSYSRTEKVVRAHIFAYELHNGGITNRIENKIHVLHRCDNPPCVSFHHLFKGTQKENMQDMLKKERDNYPYGERIGTAKITNEGVLSVFTLHSQGYLQREIAEMYGVLQPCISRILNGKNRIKG